MRSQHASQFTAVLILAISCAGGSAFAGNAPANYKGHKLAGEAKISFEQARQIAMAACKGKITDEELEHEDGGSGLRYTFDIRKGKTVHEVGVDAVTGAVLENQEDTPNTD